MQRTLPMVLKLVFKLQALTCTWQGQGNTILTQTKQSSSVKGGVMQEDQ
jgi:hypothetical protein